MLIQSVKEREKFKPEQDFHYLWYVGVKTANQGQGKDSKLIQKIMQEPDGKALHLQTSNPRNFPLYERRGFNFDGDYSQPGYAVKVYTYSKN